MHIRKQVPNTIPVNEMMRKSETYSNIPKFNYYVQI